MEFNNDITQLSIELPSSWQHMIYCMAALATGLFIVYMIVLWRYLVLSRTSKMWFSALYATIFVTTLGTIFLENIFY